MSPSRRMLAVLSFLLLSAPASALEIQPVTDGVWALVGEMQQRSPENLANNATFGVVVTAAGTVLVDSGGSRKGAEQIHDAIRKITDQPVKYVINTGGQDHRWLGNAYWQALGATVIASEKAVADHHDRVDMQMAGLKILLGDALDGTEARYADVTFKDTYGFDLGGVHFRIAHPGPAHTPGDSYVWLADRKTVFTGDIVYTERLLGVLDYSSIAGWPKAFEAVAALEPVHVVPGHGHATTISKARADTYDYLVNLRTRMAAHIDAGGDIIGSVEVDQSAFAYLDQFDSLARRNAQAAFQQMEWE
ncbi:MBL fold metallo-hydrolase [Thalassospiraceae bacterium LMO-JJ14]|nr:MBL fold metallo-hydrolase [Thalassospiraceae bacterium LMO-JJ14]